LKNKLLILMTIVSPIIGCSKDDSGPPAEVFVTCADGGDQSVGIINGTIVGRNSPLANSLVFVVQRLKGGASICTGSLIDSNIVLTAAHCVDEAAEVEDVEIWFSPQQVCDLQNKSVDRKKADEVIIHKGYNPKSRKIEDDLAVVRISGPAPSGKRTIKLVHEFLKMSSSSEIYVAGYGKTKEYDVEDKNDPLLRYTKVKPLNFGRGSNDESASVLFFDQSSGSSVCAGDSGGPAMMRDSKGILRQIGVASYVFNPQDPDAACSYGVAYTSVTKYKDWITTVYRALANEHTLGKSNPAAPFEELTKPEFPPREITPNP